MAITAQEATVSSNGKHQLKLWDFATLTLFLGTVNAIKTIIDIWLYAFPGDDYLYTKYQK